MLIFLILLPTDRYQLVHDYLVYFIRQRKDNELLAELAQEREQRLQAEANLQREQEAKQILATANREAEKKIKQGRKSLILSSSLSAVFFVVASIASVYAVVCAANKIQEVQKGTELERGELMRLDSLNLHP